MKVIITSGGTREHIDNVRTLSNISSGRLGQLIAESFLNLGVEVIYIHGVHSMLPVGDYEAVQVDGVLDLERALGIALQNESVVAVVHAMAVSDYFVSSVFGFENLAENLANKAKNEIEYALHHFEEYGYDRSRKIGSSESGLAILLKPAPKIITMIKELRPDIILVGFKLLVGVAKTELINVGFQLLLKNHCDLVLANDLIHIQGDQHTGHLINTDGSYRTFESKQEIAAGITEAVIERVGR